MKITDDRARDLLLWLDDQAGDHTLLFDEMTRYRDAAALIRQLQAEVQDSWHAGLDAGREQGRGKDHAQQPAVCAHSWHDYGTVNRAWCSACNAVAVIWHEDRPYGVLSVTDDGEYLTDSIQQPAAVDESLVERFCRRWFQMSGRSLDRPTVRKCLAKALAAQSGGSDNE